MCALQLLLYTLPLLTTATGAPVFQQVTWPEHGLQKGLAAFSLGRTLWLVYSHPGAREGFILSPKFSCLVQGEFAGLLV